MAGFDVQVLVDDFGGELVGNDFGCVDARGAQSGQPPLLGTEHLGRRGYLIRFDICFWDTLGETDQREVFYENAQKQMR